MLMLPQYTLTLADRAAVAVEAALLIGEAAHQAIAQRGVFRLVLAGGATPHRAYQLLASTAQDWAKWEIFFGDERCLPADHPERNSLMAFDAWLARVAIPPAQIHVIAAERGAADAAADYAKLIGSRRPFDLVLLGMGEDGHTASLFPGGPTVGDASVIAIGNAPKPPAERVSLNYASLRDTHRQLVLVTGAGKAAALAAWRRGDAAGAALPIVRAVRDDACLLVDRAAQPEE
jgi:6-phosphogluconolactonase